MFLVHLHSLADFSAFVWGIVVGERNERDKGQTHFNGGR